MRRIRIADFSTHVSGPTGSLLLRSVGAEVVKIENHRFGDGNRSVPSAPMIGANSTYHQALNFGARSIAADSQSEEWPAVVRAMAKWADCVIAGGRPSDARRLGLDRETIAAINPQAIHCHISGYGPLGPWAERAAHGQNPDALAGLVELEADESGHPRIAAWKPGGTSFAGAMAAMAILAALWHRAERGVVLNVETSLWEAAVWWNWRELTPAANNAEEWKIREFGSRYGVYRAADDRPILIAPIEKKFWDAFCEIAGLEDLRSTGDWSSRYDVGEKSPASRERVLIADAIRMRTLEEWAGLFGPKGIPFCEILTANEVLRTPQAEAMKMLVPIENGDGFAIRPPVRLVDGNGIPAIGIDGRLPALGEHSQEYRPLIDAELRKGEVK
ncbi:CoA transferase [Amycolatopsis jejuensis]|uniref:CoA transferase n=1 Tax=Amycolatopsis jejuensis TaxID=330084 RepID=UPI0012E019F1|nr:CaiB/BaiF CoA-transferase family protein [Amycolatopsis jejuensis]